METVAATLSGWSALYDEAWEKRDRRVDDWQLMASPWPTLVLCAAYVFLVKVWGPRYMRDRELLDVRTVLVWYNAAQVVLSTYLFVQLLRAGWWNDYSFRCQPVDYSDGPKARLMLHCCWLYYLSKFVEFADTVGSDSESNLTSPHPVLMPKVGPLSVCLRREEKVRPRLSPARRPPRHHANFRVAR